MVLSEKSDREQEDKELTILYHPQKWSLSSLVIAMLLPFPLSFIS